jgi:cell division protein FtsL
MEAGGMSLFDHRVRGFRLVHIVAVGVLAALVLGVYLAKTMAGRERAEIAQAERQIDAERLRIRLLEAEVQHLERPDRIERLAVAHLKMEPVKAEQEASADKLPQIALREETKGEAAHEQP